MTITAQARAYLNDLLTGSEGLVIGLTSGGCTGFTASLKKTPLKTCTGTSIDGHGRVFIENEETRQILQGAELRLVKDPFSTALHIVPPEGYHACGCGASFSPNYGI